jgi:hypothetical protein
MKIGFSTGSLAFGDVRLALKMLAGQNVAAVELSALREKELTPLIEVLDSLELHQFSYISFHAPSRLNDMPEALVVELLLKVTGRGWPVIVHPDVIAEDALWHRLGNLLCIENMDKRKPVGRTAAELNQLFLRFPQATLCFDIGHARQIDPTMCEATAILRRHGGRIRQIHLSLVASNSRHERLNRESLLAFRRVARQLPRDVPVILETPVGRQEMDEEISRAESVFADVSGI